MHMQVQLGWGSLVAVAPLVIGVALALRGVRGLALAFPHPRSASMRPLPWMAGFQLLLFGSSLAGIGAAWLWHLPWLLALSFAVGFEETLETSIAISALRAARDTPAPAAPQRSAATASR